MRRAGLGVLVLAAALAPSLAAAPPATHDLNGDGRVDLADVRLLARMAAGLDPANPAFDQDGDGRITLEDVDALAAHVDIETSPEPAPAAAAPSHQAAPAVAPSPHSAAAAGPGGTRYLVVRQASDGQVVVAVGAQAVQPGDRILGVYGTLAEATAERDRLTGGAPAVAPRPPAPAPPSPAPAAAPPARAAGRAAPVTPELVGTRELVPLEAGRAVAVIDGRREGWLLTERGGASATVGLTRCDLAEFRKLGEPVTGAAPYFSRNGRGDALFVFLPERGDARILKGLSSGSVRPVRVTMVPTLQGRSGGIVVVPRRGKRGETTAVYLYHWPSGTALYAEGLANVSHRLRTHRLGRFPVTGAEPVIVPVLGRAGATRSFTVLDPASRGIWCVLNVRPRPSNPRPVSVAADLSALAPPGVAGTLALAAAPLMGEDGRSSDALVVEGRSGRVAVLEHHDEPARIRLRVLDATLDGVLPLTDGPRRLAVMTLSEPGTALVLDGASGRMVRVETGRGGAVRIVPLRGTR